MAMKIYTKTGDKGQTGLCGGRRVRKDSLRVEVCGTVDELNSFLAVAKSHLSDKDALSKIVNVQRDLLILGADVATPNSKTVPKRTPRIGPHQIKKLEGWIDEIQAGLPRQTRFFLPGGSIETASLEVARSVCRRAERRLWTLADKESVNEKGLIYLNRLSDFLYVLARWINQHQRIAEAPFCL
jgi:cob(I)alamin adenosyltransferase